MPTRGHAQGSPAIPDAEPCPTMATSTPAESPAAEAFRPSISTGLAVAAFAALVALHLPDFAGRQERGALRPELLKPTESGGLGLSTEQADWLAWIFVIGLVAAAPAFGWLADRVRRTRLLAGGLGLAGLAILGARLARDFGPWAVAQGMLGVGEALLGVVALTLIVDLFPREFRARALAAYLLTMPLGASLGMALGASGLGVASGARPLFLLAGLPALVLAGLVLRRPDPLRGASEGLEPERLRLHERTEPSHEDYRDLLVNSSFTYSVMGLALFGFALGGLAAGVPAYLIDTRGLASADAIRALGILAAAATLIGTIAGAWACDRLATTRPRAPFVVSGAAMLVSVPFVLLALFSDVPAAIYAGLFLGLALMFVCLGPCAAIIAGVTAPHLRGVAYGVAVAASYALGGLGAPPLIGWASRTFGKADTMASPLGDVLAALGALPVRAEGRPSENLVAALLLVVPALVLSGVVLLSGARHLPRERALMLARLRATTAAAVQEPA